MEKEIKKRNKTFNVVSCKTVTMDEARKRNNDTYKQF